MNVRQKNNFQCVPRKPAGNIVAHFCLHLSCDASQCDQDSCEVVLCYYWSREPNRGKANINSIAFWMNNFKFHSKRCTYMVTIPVGKSSDNSWVTIRKAAIADDMTLNATWKFPKMKMPSVYLPLTHRSPLRELYRIIVSEWKYISYFTNYIVDSTSRHR